MFRSYILSLINKNGDVVILHVKFDTTYCKSINDRKLRLLMFSYFKIA